MRQFLLLLLIVMGLMLLEAVLCVADASNNLSQVPQILALAKATIAKNNAVGNITESFEFIDRQRENYYAFFFVTSHGYQSSYIFCEFHQRPVNGGDPNSALCQLARYGNLDKIYSWLFTLNMAAYNKAGYDDIHVVGIRNKYYNKQAIYLHNGKAFTRIYTPPKRKKLLCKKEKTKFRMGHFLKDQMSNINCSLKHGGNTYSISGKDLCNKYPYAPYADYYHTKCFKGYHAEYVYL
jgi:hypothetical protein